MTSIESEQMVHFVKSENSGQGLDIYKLHRGALLPYNTLPSLSEKQRKYCLSPGLSVCFMNPLVLAHICPNYN